MGTGGTGQALRIAIAHRIPVYDLAHNAISRRITKWVEQPDE